jgi:hypothetical protein
MAFEVIRDFHQLDPRLWEELTREHPSPFSHYTFWKALFISRSLGPELGWDPVFFLWKKTSKQFSVRGSFGMTAGVILFLIKVWPAGSRVPGPGIIQSLSAWPPLALHLSIPFSVTNKTKPEFPGCWKKYCIGLKFRTFQLSNLTSSNRRTACPFLNWVSPLGHIRNTSGKTPVIRTSMIIWATFVKIAAEVSSKNAGNSKTWAIGRKWSGAWTTPDGAKRCSVFTN